MTSRSLKQVLVTGGAGFIGSTIARLACQEIGARVVVLDDLSSGHRSNLDGLSVTFVEGDVCDPAAVRHAIGGCDTVFHLAASVGNTRSIENPIRDAEVNVLGTLRILEGARQAGAGKVVYSSSAGIFGELTTLPIREDHPIDPDTPYGASKLAGEKLCLAYAKLYPIEAVCLRYFNVYGVNQRYDAYGNVIPIFAHRILSGEPITIYGDGEQTRDFVNVRDVAWANLRAAMSPRLSGAFNIGSGTRITINRLVSLMIGESGVHTPIEYGAPRKGDVRDSLADISAAQAAFGHQPSVRLEDGLREYMDWARGAPVAAR